MDLEKLIITPDTSLKDAIKKIDANTQGTVIVVDPEMRVVDLLTDGDIRRTILQNPNLDRPVSELRPRRENSDYPAPITAPRSTSRRKLLDIMKEHSFRSIPLLDESGKLIEVALVQELETQVPLRCRVVIMAGGYGKRLKPLTDDTPKPLLPVGEKPLIELLLNRLSSAGFKKVFITTHYRRDQIASYFSNGSGTGVEIQFIEEKKPMGTAGALSLIESSELPLLVINGDILTMLDFRSLFRFHQDHENCMTVGLHQISYQVPYGVVQLNGSDITSIQEKPSFSYFVNAGIYMMSPAAHGKIPKTDRFDMTDLIQLLLKQGSRVVGFPIHEYWLDIGHLDDYQKANEAMWQGEFG